MTVRRKQKTATKSGFVSRLVERTMAGLLLIRKPVKKDLRSADFSTSTQRKGIRFTESLRDRFRGRWIRPSRTSRK